MSLGKGMGGLCSLVVLRAAGNALSEVFDEIAPTLKLKDAHLKMRTPAHPPTLALSLRPTDSPTTQPTNHAQVPDQLRHLVHLELIDLADNKLTALPSSLTSCTALSVLRVPRNALVRLCPGLAARIPYAPSLAHRRHFPFARCA